MTNEIKTTGQVLEVKITELEAFREWEKDIIDTIESIFEDVELNLNYSLDLNSEIEYLRGNLRTMGELTELKGRRINPENWKLCKMYERLYNLTDSIDNELYTKGDLTAFDKNNVLEIYRLFSCYTSKRKLKWNFTERGQYIPQSVSDTWENEREK